MHREHPSGKGVALYLFRVECAGRIVTVDRFRLPADYSITYSSGGGGSPYTEGPFLIQCGDSAFTMALDAVMNRAFNRVVRGIEVDK